MFATRLQPRLKIFSCDIYLQKQCKLFVSFALSLLLFLCDCGALSGQRKKKHSRDVSDLSVTSTWWRDCTKSFASTRSLFNYHAIIFVVIEYMILGLILLQIMQIMQGTISLLPSWVNLCPWLPGAERKWSSYNPQP